MYMVICRGLNSSMYKYSLVNLNTLKTTTVTKREILDLINNGKILTNVIVNLGDIEIINCPTRDNKYVICEYGDKLLELEYDGVIMTEYVVSDKGRYTGSTLLPKVSKELLDKVDDMYRKHIDKSCTLGIKQRFNYIVLNEENILLDRFLETSDIMYVPKFINSITENAMSSQNRRVDGLIGFGYSDYTAGYENDDYSNIIQKLKVKKVILHRGIKYISMMPYESELDNLDGIKEYYGEIVKNDLFSYK